MTYALISTATAYFVHISQFQLCLLFPVFSGYPSVLTNQLKTGGWLAGLVDYHYNNTHSGIGLPGRAECGKNYEAGKRFHVAKHNKHVWLDLSHSQFDCFYAEYGCFMRL